MILKNCFTMVSHHTQYTHEEEAEGGARVNNLKQFYLVVHS